MIGEWTELDRPGEWEYIGPQCGLVGVTSPVDVDAPRHGWGYDIGYNTYSYRDGPEYVHLVDGLADTLEQAFRAVEWLVAVAEGYEVEAERQIDDYLADNDWRD